jgi:hypothetical protein
MSTPTDQRFIKKEYKHSSRFEKFMYWFVPLLTIGTMVAATLFLFVWEQECTGIDKEFAYCYVHPISVWGFIGLILFYFGGLWISSLLPRLLVALGVEDDTNFMLGMRVVAFICLLGFFLIYI